MLWSFKTCLMFIEDLNNFNQVSKNKIGIWPNGLAPWSGPYGLVRPGRFRSSEDPTGPWTPRCSPSPPFSPPLALEPRERRCITAFSRPLPALSDTDEVVLGSALKCSTTSPGSIWSIWPLSTPRLRLTLSPPGRLRHHCRLWRAPAVPIAAICPRGMAHLWSTPPHRLILPAPPLVAALNPPCG
jgi:hypothetical protein